MVEVAAFSGAVTIIVRGFVVAVCCVTPRFLLTAQGAQEAVACAIVVVFVRGEAKTVFAGSFFLGSGALALNELILCGLFAGLVGFFAVFNAWANAFHRANAASTHTVLFTRF